MKYNKIFVFLFILICFTSIAYSADETLNNVFNEANDYENVENNKNIENTDNNNINNIEEELIEEDYEDNPIPDNNFEDGYDHSEIIELNDNTIYSDDEIITNTTHPTSRPNRAASNNNNIQTPIVSVSHSYISAKVALKKITDTTYNTTFIVTDNCSIYYTLNGNNPTTASTKYTKAFIYNTSKTLKYFAITKDGDKGPVLSMKLSEGTTPYIAYKTPITNKIQTIYLSYTLPQTKIYYTLNGSTPTNKSSEYTKALSINNNTKLKFIAVYGTKTTPVYQYMMNAVKPTVTIKNTTDVRNNYQNITIKINKPGKIYYTRNGSNPTNQSNIWTNNTNVMISIKTQVRTILIDNEGFTSDITYYQPPKIITPPITAIRPITTLINNIQKIQFSTNQQNSTIYYTTDKSNPLTSNTTKTAKNNDKINLNKNTRLKYYTKDDIQGYKSAVYNYTPVQNANERPTITIINATNIWNNGQQKIIIQSNQPGKFNITRYTNNTDPVEYLDNTGSFTTNQKYQIQVYTKYNEKYSIINEYQTSTGTRSIMNYHYKITLSKINDYGNVYFYVNGEEYSYPMNSLVLYKYIHININNQTELSPTNPLLDYGITIHKSYNLEITFHDKMYGNLNTVNAITSCLSDGTETFTLYSNDEMLMSVFLTKKYDYTKNYDENVTTTFQTLTNTLTKTETITFQQKTVRLCGQYDTIQTYLLTNTDITTQITNQTLKKLENNNDILKIPPQDRTVRMGILAIWAYDAYTKYLNYQYNATSYRSDETLLLIGINEDRTNYIHYNDLKMGLVITANDTNKYLFNTQASARLPELARMALNTVKVNIGKIAQTILMQLSESSTVYALANNQTNTLKFYSPDLLNVYILQHTDTGIIENIMIFGNFSYNGAITDPLVEEGYYDNNPKNKTLKKSSTMECFESQCNFDSIEGAHSIFGFGTDSGWAVIESFIGGGIAGIGVGIAMGAICVAGGSFAIAVPLMLGIGIIADSHGLFSGQATRDDWIGFAIDVGMVAISPGVSSLTSKALKASFSRITMGETVRISSLKCSTKVKNFLTVMKTTSQECINFGRDEIISKGLNDTVYTMMGW